MSDSQEDLSSGLRWALILDGAGGARPIGWEEVRAWRPQQGPLWVHVDRTQPDTQAWLRGETGLDAPTCEALLAEETRPRSFPVGEGLLIILRGVNLNPGAEPDDMLSVRLWVEADRLITLRHRQFKPTTDVLEELQAGKGPTNVPRLMLRVVQRLTDRVEPVLDDLDERADELEEGFVARDPREVRAELAELRRQVIALRRYLAPQRATLGSLVQETMTWLDPAQRAQLRELADRTMRFVEHLEELRERAGVIHDELANHVAEQVNSRMYVLSLVAAIFLPLTLLTGLLGINVGGIPGAEDPRGFLAVCALVFVLGALLAAGLRWLRWV